MKTDHDQIVSCIIPTRNRQDLLRKSLESVISQTYRNLEIIVVDDASDDDTGIIVREYMDRDIRINYIKTITSMGGSGARNIGIKEAIGEYVAFLDDDDYWNENKIAEQINFIDDFDAVICAAFSKNGKKVIVYHKTLVNPIILKRGNVFFGGTSIILARSHAIKNTLFDEKLLSGQDWDLLIRMASKYHVGYSDTPLVYYNDGDHKRISNELVNMPFHQLENRLRAIEKHKDFLGRRWYNYHIASILLSYMKYRDNKISYIVYTIKRCGLCAMLSVFLNKSYRNYFKSKLVG